MADNNSPLIFERIFDAPVELVWKAWTDEEIAKKWWGPKDFTCPHATIDARVGGQYLLSMKGPEGSAFDKEIWSTGTYKEIVLNERIVVTDSFSDENGNVVSPTEYGMPESFPQESTITITFEQLEDGKTKMIVTYPTTEGIEGEMLVNMTQGWNEQLDKLTQLLGDLRK